MNLLQVNKYYPPIIGGIESVTKDIADGLAARGINVQTLVCQHTTKKSVLDEQHVTRAKTLCTLWRMPISLSFFWHFRRLVKQSDIVLLHHPFPLGFLAYSLFGRKKPLVVFYHSDIIRQQRIAKWLHRLFTSVLQQADTIIATSQRLVEYSPLLKPYRKKTNILSLWVNEKNLQPTRSTQVKHQQDKPLILAVGRLVPYKGYDVLLRAMQNIDAQLMIVGEGPLHKELVELVDTLQINENVNFLQKVKDLSPYYNAADVFVLPSTQRSEAFGIVQLEAMYFGLPVINTNLTTGVPEVSVHKKTGLTVPVNNAEALAQAIRQLLDNPEQRTHYGQAARLKARTVLMDQQMDKLETLLQQV